MPKEEIKQTENLSDEEIIREAKERLRIEIERDSENRTRATNDLEFVYCEGAQWDEKTRTERETRDRHTKQVNILPKYTEQVTGEIRLNKIKAKVSPADSDGDTNLAELREGMIYNIQYESEAETIFDDVGQGITECGYGAMRAVLKYTEENPFIQKPFIEWIEDPLTSVYMDSHGKSKVYADAEYGFVLDRITKDEFKRRYPGQEIPTQDSGLGQGEIDHWVDDDTVAIAEYFYKEYSKKHLALLSDGDILEYNEAVKVVEEAKLLFEQVKSQGKEVDETSIPEIAKDRIVETPKVKWVRMISNKILDKNEWPGTIIPIVLVHGKLKTINGRRYISGLIRNAKDAQEIYNNWHTTVLEVLSQAPNNPLVVTPQMIQGFEKDYNKLHKEIFPYLQFNPDTKLPGPPQRLAPSQPSPALFSELDRAERNIENTIGMHKADVGNAGRELSGDAIEARQLPGHISTFIYLDNLSKGVAQMGKILVDVFPQVYDTERNAPTRKEDDTEAYVPINTTVGKALDLVKKHPMKFSGLKQDELEQAVEKEGANTKFNMMNEGKYNVVVSAGPAFETRRQEAAHNMLQLAQISSTADKVALYYTVKYMDFDGANDYAESIRKMIPYGVLPPKPGEKPPPLPKPNPEEVMELQIKVLDREVQKAKQGTEKQRTITEKFKQQKEILKMQTDLKESDVKIKGEIAKTIKELNKDVEIESTANNA
ncbi:MAG: hypothetical protein GY928_20575 [Colwellia sp.]|nr:hypothetical protein [Colwellia sp.]